MPVGRKIGFTNRTIWAEYNVYGPIWGSRATDVLGGPLSALRHLIDILARDQVNPPLAAGEIITTGTLTRALPVSAGETWTTKLTGVAFDGICVRFA